MVTEIVDYDKEIKKANPTPEDVEVVVEDIVKKWNTLVVGFQNTTIRLCMMIQDTLKSYPNQTVKEVLTKVKKHPNIKRFVSIDRIYQGIRLIDHRPDLIQYHLKNPVDKAKIDDDSKPYLKKDGEVFWEFYFELAKQPMTNDAISYLEEKGKTERWSFRELRQKIQETKDRDHQGGAYEVRRQEKYKLIKEIIGICKELPVENLRGVSNFAKELRDENAKKDN